MNPVMKWVKSNVYTVIFVAVMILAPVGLLLFAGKMNQGVREEVKRRSGKLAELAKIEKTSVRLVNPVKGNPPIEGTLAVNQQFLSRYQEVLRRIGQDVGRITSEAVEFNSKDRGVLLDELFPEPPMHKRETLRKCCFQSSPPW